MAQEFGLGDRHGPIELKKLKLPLWQNCREGPPSHRLRGNDLSERAATLLVLGADVDRSGKKSRTFSTVSGTVREGADPWLTSWCQKAAATEWDLFPKSTFVHCSMGCAMKAADMFYPFHSAATLALTSTRVVGLRLEKIAAGGFEAFRRSSADGQRKISLQRLKQRQH